MKNAVYSWTRAWPTPATTATWPNTSSCCCFSEIACFNQFPVAVMLQRFQCGSIGTRNIVLPTGESAVPYLMPEMKLQAGATPHLLPDTTRNGGTAQSTCSAVSCVSPHGCSWQCTTMLRQGNPPPISSPGHWQDGPHSLQKS